MTQLAAAADDFIYEAAIELSGGRAAGLAFRMDDGREGGVVAYDAADRVMYWFSPGAWNEAPVKITRRVAHPVAPRFRLKVVARREHIEGYLDDQLYLTVARYGRMEGRFGLYVDRAQAAFAEVRARRLRVDAPA